ncbi:MAG: nuclear transport factor 2 family protein [Acidimicrobiales bacterium]
MSEAQREIEDIYNQWFAASPRKDVELIGSFLSDDWIYTDIVGEVRNKEQYLGLAPLIQSTHSSHLVDLTLRSYEDFVIVHGNYLVKGVLTDGRDVSSNTRFTGVWVQRDGRWQNLTHHATSIQEVPS